MPVFFSLESAPQIHKTAIIFFCLPLVGPLYRRFELYLVMADLRYPETSGDAQYLDSYEQTGKHWEDWLENSLTLLESTNWVRVYNSLS